MRLTPQRFYIYLLTLLLWLDNRTTARKHHKCPIGFHLAYTKDEMPICYREKGPETFAEKFKDCTGNLYTSKLYHSLNLTKTNKVLWTEYKSLYPGGPFIDWSYTASAGDILVTTYDVKYDTTLGIDEELCVIIDPVSNFTATRCYEKHYRYCFVHPYPDEHDMGRKGCAGFRGSWRFYSPTSDCLTAVTGVGGGTVRATWRQAQELCSKRGGSLLHRGWRYSNNPLLHTSGSYPMYPMGVVMNTEHDILRYDADNDTEEIPDSDWHFETTQSPVDAVFGAVRDEFWYLVNSSYVFFDVICEKPAPLRYLDLKLTVDWEANIFLAVNDTIKKNDISCYSDSLVYYPSSTDISKTDDEQILRVDPDHDGYYWCIQYDYKNFHVSTSNRALFIRSKQSVLNLYACKIRLKNEYRFENLDKLYKVWKKKLEVFIYYRTKYVSVYGDMNTTDPYEAERLLKAFKSAKPDLNWKDSDVIFNLKIKRLYLDSRTALVHVMLNPEMQPLMPGLWDTMEVLFMKPAYFCKGFNSVPTLPLGESVTTTGSRMYSCIGDFNEGVQWVESFARDYNPTPVEITELYGIEDVTVPNTLPDMAKVQQQQTTEDSQSSSEEYHSRSPRPKPSPPEGVNTTTETISEVITVTTSPDLIITVTIPPIVTETQATTEYSETTTALPLPTTSLPPDIQLDQLLEDLEALLQNETLPLESITTTFDQVNDILDVEDEHLEIPGQLLHMLDELGARVQLQEGESTAVEVRHNVALLLADVSPTHPVLGLRVAARDNDAFDNQSFHFIASDVGAESLVANETEALVQLPASVSRVPRRVSFVAFRNQRAFPSSLVVNSRVFSVNVENLTTFDEGEVIDIHLTPLVEAPGREARRACAYWQFAAGGGGQWSRAGCQLLRGGAGLLDTCRCTHLTHFAEVLVPRTLFSERDERALEVLSLVGCFVSMFGLAVIALTAGLFRSWRREYGNKVWLHLCGAVLALAVCFVVVVFARFERYGAACMTVGVALHYSVLASFCWMLVAAVLSYRRLVVVFARDASHKLLRAAAFAWGAPCAVVGILLSVDPQSYAGRFEEKAPSGSFCYPSGLALWLAVYAPIAVMLLANWTLFALIVRSVFASRRIQRHGDSNEALRCASVSCLLVFLFGLPWIFGLFASNVVAAYLFTLTATFQGFVLFLFFVVGNKKTRDLWLNKLKIKQTRKVPVTSSTYTNRSTGPGWRGGGAEASPVSTDAKTTKPRSLSSPDDSRFS
ncbi:unnamed protein product [Diatraea saccharalis]|uniref:Uncharacterized protein n=1 Tax=Diatraea saccharalis TaxID=40085 RepID=A0A9N9QUB5_9NEOP|nr:unnamed protein product [Diatraea saccharalis]